MSDESLKWEVRETKLLLRTPVFDVLEQAEQAAAGPSGAYVAMTAPDWVMVVPVLGENFVLVRQWRHAARRLTTEFPGGVLDGDEDPAEAAARELWEETGFKAGKLTRLGSLSPNPALFANTFHCYLAEELVPTGQQHLDADELVAYELRPISRVIAEFGSPEFSHALMGTALALYLGRRSPEAAGGAKEEP